MNHNLIGGKGGASSFKTAPDTLRSNDSFEVLLGLGSGRWKGLTNGLESLYVNDVPLQNEDGTSNFKDFQVLFADGDPAQTQLVNFKLGGGGGTTQVNTQIGNTNGTGTPGPWINAAVSTTGADFIDLRLVISALYYQDNKGVRANTMSLEIQMRPSGTQTWVNPLLSNTAPSYNLNGFPVSDGSSGVLTGYMLRQNWDDTGENWSAASNGYLTINDKTTSPAVKELRISVPNTGVYSNKTWQVRIRLIEPELRQADPIEERRTVQFESITAVTNKTFGDADEWRGLVWMQLVGKASEQISGVPAVKGIFETKVVKTPPSNIFNPTTRTYTGALWDGSYVLNYTTDPAWCIKDLIEDPISGIAALSPGATLDKWDALEASKYYSQQVSDGRGGTHPRFSLNVKIDQAQNAEDLIQYLAGAVNSLAVDTGDSQWRLKVDKPETPTRIFTRDNIIGEFQYSHTDVDSRYNDYTVTFLNKENRYEEDRARVFDQAHIDRFGRKPTTVVAMGANNRQEALRRAMYRLRVSTNENTLVNFVTNRQGLMVEPLSVILVADTDLGYVGSVNSSGNRTTTRISSISGSTIVLGSTVRLEVGVNYSINLTVPNPNYNPNTTTQPGSVEWQKPTVVISRNVLNNASQRGDVSILYLDASLPANTPSRAPIALNAVGLPSLPVQYRVMEVTPSEDNETVTIQALIIDTGKWAAMDNVNEDEVLGQVSNTTVPAPIAPPDGIFSMRYFQSDFQEKRVLTVTWERPGSLFLAGFRVEYKFNDGPWRLVSENTQQTYVELQQPQSGDYTYRIASVDRRGRLSEYLSDSISIADTAEDYAPVQGVGPLFDRPDFGSKEGEKYTTTDQNPNQTFIWHDGAWIPESNYVDAANQIYYDGGGTVESLKPAEPGATNGAPEGSYVAGRLAQELIEGTDVNTASIISESLRQDDLLQVFDARTLVEGQPVSTTVLNFRDSQTTANSAFSSSLDLLGAKTPDGTAWNLNLNTVKVSPDKTLSTRLEEIGAVTDDATVSVKFLQDIFVGDGQANAKTVLRSEANGTIGAFDITANGVTRKSTITMVANELQFVDPNNGNPIIPFSISAGQVYAQNFVADTITYNSLIQRFSAIGRQMLTSDNFYFVIPGNPEIIVQGGQYHNTIGEEVTFVQQFNKPFPNACITRGAMGWIANFSDQRDLWLQNVGNPTSTQCVFATQAATKNNRTLDGYDWWAIGY